MKATGLTRKQDELFRFIVRYIEIHGVAPTYEEMKEAMGLASKCGIHRLIHQLEERGRIARVPYRARAIVLAPAFATMAADLPAEEAIAVRRLAVRRGVTPSTIIQEAVRAHLRLAVAA